MSVGSSPPSELKAGVPELRIVDGRADHSIRRDSTLGLPLRDGAVLIEENSDGMAAQRYRTQPPDEPSDPLLTLLAGVCMTKQRGLPALLAARRMVARGLRLIRMRQVQAEEMGRNTGGRFQRRTRSRHFEFS